MEEAWEDRHLITYLAGRGAAPREELDRCLAKCAALRRKGERVPLGIMLVERGLVTPALLDEARQAVRSRSRRCPCGADIYHPPEGKGSPVPCPACGRESPPIDAAPAAAPPAAPPPEPEPEAAPAETADVPSRPPRAASGRGSRGAPPNPAEGTTRVAPDRDRKADAPGRGGSGRRTGQPKIGPYLLEAELGRGAVGIVYRARHTVVADRLVALKVLHWATPADDYQRQRFEREAQALAVLDHPAIVRVHEAREDKGQLYFTMDLVDGTDLSHLLGDQPVEDIAWASTVFAEILDAVAHAHARGVIHRDLKLANVILAKDGHVRLTDFGLARIEGTVTRLTETGDLLGTPFYMAPEVFEGHAADADARADVYALGVMLFRILTGTYPFVAETPAEVFRLAQTTPPRFPDALAAKIPLPLQAICKKALEKAPPDRYPHAGAMAEDLARFRSGLSVEARAVPRTTRLLRLAAAHPRVVVATVLAALLVGVSARFLRSSPGTDDPAEEARRHAVGWADERADELLRAHRAHLDLLRGALQTGDIPQAADAIDLARAAVGATLALPREAGLDPLDTEAFLRRVEPLARYREILALAEGVAGPLAAERPAPLIALSDAILALAPEDERALLVRARARAAAGNRDGALADIETLIAMLAGGGSTAAAAEAHLVLARVRRSSGDRARALQEAEIALSLGAGGEADELRATFLFDDAMDARADLARALAAGEPQSLAAPIAIRRLLREACTSATRALADRRTAARLLLRGRTRLLLDRPAQAMEDFQAAQSMEPDYRTVESLAAASEFLGDAERALGYYRQAIDEASRQDAPSADRARLLTRQGDTYLASLRWDEAEASYRRAIDADPRADLAAAHLAWLLVSRQTPPDPARASDLFAGDLDRRPDVLAARAWVMAYCYSLPMPPMEMPPMVPAEMRRHAEDLFVIFGQAERDARRLLDLRPGDPVGLAVWGFTSTLRGDPAARDRFDHAQAIARSEISDAEVYYRRARVLAEQIPARVDPQEVARRAQDPQVGIVGLFSTDSMGEDARATLDRAYFLARRAELASFAHPFAPLLCARLRLLYWADPEQAFVDYRAVFRADQDLGRAYAFLIDAFTDGRMLSAFDPNLAIFDLPWIQERIRRFIARDRSPEDQVLPEDRRLVYSFRAEELRRAARRGDRHDWGRGEGHDEGREGRALVSAAESYVSLAQEMGLTGLDAYHAMVAHRNAADCFEEAGDSARAAVERERSTPLGLQRLASQARSLLARARERLRAGAPDEARSLAREALALDHSLGAALFLAGVASLRLFDPDAALPDLAGGAASEPAALGDLFASDLGLDWREAAATLSAESEMDDAARLFLAFVGAEITNDRDPLRIEEGLAAASRLLAASSGSVGAYVMRGRLHEILGDDDEARDDYETAALLRPADPLAAAYLIRALSRGGVEAQRRAAELGRRFEGALPPWAGR